MTSTHPNDAEIAREGGRILTFYGILVANGLAFGALLFWLIGAIRLLSGSGGLINQLELGGVELGLYWAMPVVVVLSLLSWLAYLLKLDQVALAIAGSPLAVGVLYYLWLVFGRNA